MNDTLVELVAVQFAHASGRTVLSDCSLCLQHGDRIGLMGAIGSGKTTLLELVVGLLRPTAGRVEVFGEPRVYERDFHDVRRRVGYLFQDADDQLFCPTVAEDVAFGPLNLGKPREEVRQIVSRTLHSLGLDGYEDRITYQLSGGEKRLVALATVLAMQPEVLLLDEPTAGLDEETTARVLAILASLPQSMLIVSHDRADLSRIATTIFRLQDGALEPLGG